ncbi:uncharacterized protein LODBEIA_P54120 [Lodderomyces beijingensis]|uniref:RRM domain-containing protein n=1 Tax=Lodderomyces beijingensis TaxID=1775926 RepID=A0ABP0ZSS7_9ASCO
MSSVIASNVPAQVTPAKVREFFSFCGKINDLIELDAAGATKTYEVIFASPKAVSTALLLNDAELENTFIKVEEPKAITDGAKGQGEAPVAGGSDAQASSSVLTGDKTYDDVDQEDKPKFAILAQLLADGYVLSDPIIERGTEFDKKNGISDRFNRFIKDLDSRYVHSSDPNSTVNQQIAHAQESFNRSALKKYFDDAANSPWGARIAQYYKNFSNEVKDVHEEAKRLAKIKKEKNESESSAAKPTVAAD